MKSKTMNIAMFGHKTIPSRIGGIEIVVEKLATVMVSKGHKVSCFNRTNSMFVRENKRDYKGVSLIGVPTINKKGFAAVSSSLFASIRSALGPYEIVHIHAEGPAVFCWIPHLFKKRVIVTIHGLDWQRKKWGRLASRYIHFGEKMAVKYADEIIVLSKNAQTYFKNTYLRDTIIIPNGVDEPERLVARQITTDWNLKKDDYILYVGRLVPEKGIHYLIQAFNQLNTNKKLVIAGEGIDDQSYEEELKRLANNNSNILFTGFVEGTILSELFSNAYLYCLPSDLEGMPLSLLEAMSYGNCCLVSNIKENEEVAENKAVYFEKSNAEDLKEKLQLLCDDPLLVCEYRNNSTNYILKKYNWDDTIEKTLEIYQQ